MRFYNLFILVEEKESSDDIEESITMEDVQAVEKIDEPAVEDSVAVDGTHAGEQAKEIFVEEAAAIQGAQAEEQIEAVQETVIQESIVAFSSVKNVAKNRTTKKSVGASKSNTASSRRVSSRRKTEINGIHIDTSTIFTNSIVGVGIVEAQDHIVAPAAEVIEEPVKEIEAANESTDETAGKKSVMSLINKKTTKRSSMGASSKMKTESNGIHK